MKHTFLSPLLFGPVNVVLELDPDLPLIRLVTDEGMLQELLCRGTLCIVLHQAALDETKKLFGPFKRFSDRQKKRYETERK